MTLQTSSLTRRNFVRSLPISAGVLAASIPLAFGQATATLIPNAEALSEAFTQSNQAIVDYVKLYSELDEKRKLSANDIKQLEEAATRAQAAVASDRRNVQELTRQLGAGAKWDQAEAAFAQNLQKSDLSSAQKTVIENWVKQNGGVKSALEKGSTAILNQASTSIPDEISHLKRKQASLPFDLISPAYAKPPAWLCQLEVFHATIFLLLGCFPCVLLHGVAAAVCGSL